MALNHGPTPPSKEPSWKQLCIKRGQRPRTATDFCHCLSQDRPYAILIGKPLIASVTDQVHYREYVLCLEPWVSCVCQTACIALLHQLWYRLCWNSMASVSSHYAEDVSLYSHQTSLVKKWAKASDCQPMRCLETFAKNEIVGFNVVMNGPMHQKLYYHMQKFYSKVSNEHLGSQLQQSFAYAYDASNL